MGSRPPLRKNHGDQKTSQTDEKGREQSGEKGPDLKAGNNFRDKPEQKSVQDKDEKTQGQDCDRKGQDDQDGTHENVEKAQNHRDCDGGRESPDLNPPDHPGNGKNDKGIQQKPEKKQKHHRPPFIFTPFLALVRTLRMGYLSPVDHSTHGTRLTPQGENVKKGRIERARDWLDQRLRRTPGGSWFFPHGLLALVVGLYGLKNVLPLLDQIRLIRIHLKTFGPAQDFSHLPAVFHIPGGVPQTIIGLVQLLMSAGLLLRSRFAWLVTVLLTTLSLVVIMRETPLPFLHLGIVLILLAGLILARKSFDQSTVSTGSFFSLLSILLLMGYGIFGAFILGKGFTPPITNLVTAFYFAVITMATVGYGDIVPTTDDARLFVVSLVLFGITVFSAAISSVLIPLINERLKKVLIPEKRKMPRKNHYILVGTGTLARHVFHELTSRNLPVTLIVPKEFQEPPFDQADQVVGDPADSETLKMAGALDAQAILSLLDEDAENAFVVLAARDIGSKARTIVSVRSRANFSRIRSVSPDMILSPEMIGGELIAMALNNEKIDGDSFLRKALFLDRRMKEGTEPAKEGSP